ncbi:MAG: ABC transporter ATP-binding protein [Burkholderiaceae bacterium]
MTSELLATPGLSRAGTLPQSSAVSSRSTSVGISISDVSKRYGTFNALDEVSLDIASGEFLTLLGPSGSGKTTLLNILAGFAVLDSGSVRFGDVDVSSLPPHKRGIGVVFQHYALFPHMDVQQNVAFPLSIRGVREKEQKERVAWALSLVQLEGLGGRRISELSGGQRQRVALARAIVFEPSIILMDEPLSALDKQLRERMQLELRKLHDKLRSTTVYVTHDQREALTMSDRIAVMNKGRIVQLGAPMAIYEHPANAFVADFIGESMLLEVERVGEHEVRLGGVQLKPARPVPEARRHLLALRSEKLMFDDEVRGELNLLPATFEDAVFQGESVLWIARLPDGSRVSMRRLSNSSGNRPVPQVGAPLRLAIEVGNTVVVHDE